MVYLWFISDLWFISGLSVVYLWFHYGFSAVYLGFYYGLSMAYLWLSLAVRGSVEHLCPSAKPGSDVSPQSPSPAPLDREVFKDQQG